MPDQVRHDNLRIFYETIKFGKSKKDDIEVSKRAICDELVKNLTKYDITNSPKVFAILEHANNRRMWARQD